MMKLVIYLPNERPIEVEAARVRVMCGQDHFEMPERREQRAPEGRSPMRASLVIVTIAALRMTAAAAPSAEDLYAEGQAAYDRADYATAIARWRESYAVSAAPGLLFNLAQAQRLSGDCPGALSTYRRFLASDPDPASEQHRLAEDLATELDAACDERPPTPPRIEPPGSVPALLSRRDDRPPRSGRGRRIAGLATGGAGLALLAAGLVLGHHGTALGAEVTRACAAGCDWSGQRETDAAGRRDVLVGRALDAVGAAAIVGGAILYYVGTRETLGVAPRPGGDGAVVTWGGSW
jgi:hypothetical protein